MDLLAVQGTLKSLLQHHSSKASILRHSAFFIVQLSHPYMTTGKTIALTRRTFVGQVMCLLFNMLSRLVITFLPRSEHFLNFMAAVTICRDFGALTLIHLSQKIHISWVFIYIWETHSSGNLIPCLNGKNTSRYSGHFFIMSVLFPHSGSGF